MKYYAFVESITIDIKFHNGQLSQLPLFPIAILTIFVYSLVLKSA